MMLAAYSDGRFRIMPLGEHGIAAYPGPVRSARATGRRLSPSYRAAARFSPAVRTGSSDGT